MSRRRRTARRLVEDGVAPTPETRRKLQPNPVVALHARGVIGAEEVLAAAEIHRVLTAVIGGLMARAGDPDRRSGGFRLPSDAIAVLYASRYKPWADDLSRRHKSGGPPILEVVIDIDDADSLREFTADLLYMRSARRASEQFGARVRMVLIGIVLSGLAYAAWNGIKLAIRVEG